MFSIDRARSPLTTLACRRLPGETVVVGPPSKVPRKIFLLRRVVEWPPKPADETPATFTTGTN